MPENSPVSAQKPGDLTRWPGLPWHPDVFSCQQVLYANDFPNATWWPALLPIDTLPEYAYKQLLRDDLDDATKLKFFNDRQLWSRGVSGIGYHAQGSYDDGLERMVAFFTDSDLPPARDVDWPELLAATEYTNKRIISAGFPVPTSGKVVDAATIVTKLPADDHLLAAGDTWVCFDPLSSHGMTTALWPGRRVGEVLAASAVEQPRLLAEYRKDYQIGIDNYLAEQRRIYGLEGRFAGAAFWRRGGGGA